MRRSLIATVCFIFFISCSPEESENFVDTGTIQDTQTFFISCKGDSLDDEIVVSNFDMQRTRSFFLTNGCEGTPALQIRSIYKLTEGESSAQVAGAQEIDLTYINAFWTVNSEELVNQYNSTGQICGITNWQVGGTIDLLAMGCMINDENEVVAPGTIVYSIFQKTPDNLRLGVNQYTYDEDGNVISAGFFNGTTKDRRHRLLSDDIWTKL